MRCQTCDGSGEIVVATSGSYLYPPDDTVADCEVCDGSGEISAEDLEERWGSRWPTEDEAAEIAAERTTDPWPEPYDVAGDR